MELTKQEAIESLKERYMTMSMCADKECCIKQNAAIDMAISSLKAELGRDINVGRNERLKGDRAMRDNEIIEALDFCEGYNGVSFCSRCPLFNKDNCSQILSHEAYNLIRRQKKEIERLNFDLQIMRGAANSLKMHYNTAKAEGIKEFAEKLCDGKVSNDPTLIEVRSALKEMAETKSEGVGKRIYDDFMKSCKRL